MGIDVFKDYINLLKLNKKFILIYIIFISFLTYPMLSIKNFTYPRMEIVSFIFIVFVGSFLLLYAFKNKNQVHKIVFLFILVYGVIITFIAPPFSIPDELVHIVRAETLLQGQLIPIEPKTGYMFIYGNFFNSMIKLFKLHDPGIHTLIINNSYAWIPFSENKLLHYSGHMTSTMFYSYILSMLGLLITKIFDLGIIWAVWLTRLFNLIFYAIVVRFAIKKAPVYKIPLLFLACTPLLLTIIPSANYDSFIYAIFILALAYFINMYKNKVENKDLLIFFICMLLIAFIKPPYIIFSLLVLFIPKENFTFKHPLIKMTITIFIIILITLLTVKIMSFTVHTSFGVDESSNISIVGQFNYLIHHPFAIYNIIRNSILFIYYRVFLNAFYYAKNFVGNFKGIKLFNMLYFIFFIGFSCLYPIKIKLSKYKKILMGLFLITFYIGMFFLICLCWCDVGTFNISGIQARYFIPIIPLMPLVTNIPIKRINKNPKINFYVFTGIVIFASGIIMLAVTHFY